MTIIEVAARTHLGLVRERNEDSVGVAALFTGRTLSVDGTVHRVDAPTIVVVADGLGGHPKGDEASKIAVEVIVGARPADAESLAKAVRQANEAIVSAMSHDAGNVGMGTTVAAVLATDSAIYVANVGDSSVWELVDHRLVQLSTDDSPAGRSGLPGVPSYVVTQTLGGGRWLVEVDPHVLEDVVEGERTILVCSDGLTNFVDRRAIAAALLGSGPLSTGALVQLALDAGAPDNVTVAVLRLTSRIGEAGATG